MSEVTTTRIYTSEEGFVEPTEKEWQIMSAKLALKHEGKALIERDGQVALMDEKGEGITIYQTPEYKDFSWGDVFKSLSVRYQPFYRPLRCNRGIVSWDSALQLVTKYTKPKGVKNQSEFPIVLEDTSSCLYLLASIKTLDEDLLIDYDNNAVIHPRSVWEELGADFKTLKVIVPAGSYLLSSL